MAVVIAVIGMILFLWLGKIIYDSYRYIPHILGIILVSTILAIPAIKLVNHINDSYRQYYAKHHEDKYITALQKQFEEKLSSSGLDFDRAKSNFESLYYRDKRVYLTKSNDRKLTIEEIDKVIHIVPEADVQISITIYYHNKLDATNERFHLLLNKDKTPTAVCDPGNMDDYELFCAKYVSEAYRNSGI